MEPPVAKFAPCLKFDPNEFRYALRYGKPTRSAAKPRTINQNFLRTSKFLKLSFSLQTFTYEINGETAIGVSPGGSVEETLTIRSSNGLESGRDSSGIGIRVSEVVKSRKITRGLN